jgi:hypothetical protein
LDDFKDKEGGGGGGEEILHEASHVTM